jgi:Fe2+ or Zn2+ uptake regulation protein
MPQKPKKLRVYTRAESEIEPLDPKERYPMSVLAEKVEKVSMWKKGAFDILAQNKTEKLTAADVQSKLLESGFRKVVDLESVKKALEFLVENGIALKRNEDGERYELNLKE